MIFKKNILVALSILLVQAIIAQDGPAIKASVNKNKILLGEPFEFTVEASLRPVNEKMLIQLDSIPHFEFLQKPKVDSIVKDGRLTIKRLYTMTSFDSGRWMIPSFVLANGIKTDAIPIDVVFSEFDPEQDYHDIKDVFDVKVPRKKIAWWIYVTGLLVFIIVVALLVKSKKRTVLAVTPKITIGPYDEAMRELEQLKMKKPSAKEYHSRLINIFRLYIFRKKGILSLQKTTEDLVIQLKNLNLDKAQFDKLSQALRLGDYVKFAKYQSVIEDDITSFETIRNTIKTLEQSE